MVTPSQAPPAQPSERRVTRPSNANRRPGLPDKPAPRRTSEQKQADDEHIRQLKVAQKMAEQGTYERISTMQAQMVVEESEARKNRPAVRPKPRMVKKQLENKDSKILPPRYPRQSSHLYRHESNLN